MAGQITSLKRQVASPKRSAATLRDQRDAARRSLAQTTTDRDQNHDLVVSLHSALATARSERDAARSERDAAQLVITTQDATITSLNTSLATRDATVAKQQAPMFARSGRSRRRRPLVGGA